MVDLAFSQGMLPRIPVNGFHNSVFTHYLTNFVAQKTSVMNWKDVHMEQLMKTTYKAGKAIMDIYERPIEVESKSDDSPLTAADRVSNDIILSGLNKIFPDIHIISEETRETPYSIRKDWETCWLVDPLDGTKEFIKKNGEFTVNIALIEQGEPVFGIVYLPDKDVLYYGQKGKGAFKVAARGKRAAPIVVSKPEPGGQLKVAGSRSHQSDEIKAFLAAQRKNYGNVQLESAGSALKFCRVAEGHVHVYPRLGPTMEWDTAAGQAVVLAAGGQVVRADDRTPLSYNKADLLNPYFIAAADMSLINEF